MKFLNDEGIYSNIFDVVMEWVNEYFTIKTNVYPPQKFHKRETIMKKIKRTYLDIAGGSIETKEIKVDNISSLAHCSGFLRNIYNLLNNPYLMKDAQWLPLDKESLNEDTNINEIVYSEVTSGNWYKEHMIE